MIRASRAPTSGTDEDARDRGMVTVEGAIALGGLVGVFALALAGLAMVLGQLQCVDAAREAARLLARGEQQQAEQLAAQIAPSDAKVALSTTEDTVSVTVTAASLGGVLPVITLHADAVAVREPQPPTDQPTTGAGQ